MSKKKVETEVEALIKAGTEITISGHPAKVVKITRDGVLVRVNNRVISVDFDKVEAAFSA